MANTITLPPAASRSPYDFLTVRNASDTEYLEVFPDGADAILDTLQMIVPPHDAITIQSNGVDGWASVSSSTQNEMRWRGAWQQGTTYYRGAVVNDSGWLMHANQETTERAAIIANGAPFWGHDEVPVWNSDNVVTSFLYTGLKFTASVNRMWTGVRYWCPNIAYEYNISISNVTDPANPIIEILEQPQPTETGWRLVTLASKLIFIGEVYEIAVGVRSTGGNTFLGNWNYLSPQNEAPPGSGEIIHANRDNANLHISNIDSDVTDRSGELAAISAGDLIDGPTITWTVQSVTNNGTYFTFGVTPTSQEPVDGIQQFTFTYYGDSPLPYVYISDHWAAESNVSGYYILGDETRVDNQDGYGIDVEADDITKSAHWDYMSRDGA